MEKIEKEKENKSSHNNFLKRTTPRQSTLVKKVVKPASSNLKFKHPAEAHEGITTSDSPAIK